MSARKDDGGKPPISLIPRSAILAEARVMAKGRAKYGAHNWRAGNGLAWSRLLDAALRHITAFADGEDIDDGPEGSGESHLANARCCLAFLIEYAETGMGEDDRYVRETPFDPTAPGIELQLLDNNSTSLVRRTIAGEFISLPAGRVFPTGSAVWAKRDVTGRLVYVADFEWTVPEGGIT